MGIVKAFLNIIDPGRCFLTIPMKNRESLSWQ